MPGWLTVLLALVGGVLAATAPDWGPWAMEGLAGAFVAVLEPVLDPPPRS